MKENPLILAALISLALHLTIFAGWKLNQRYGWIKPPALPAWLTKVSQKLSPQNSKFFPRPEKTEVPLIFVDVDPNLAVKEPPKETKFYGPANAQAASPVKTVPSELPEIQGKQDKVIKTTENSKSKAQPLQPSPPVPDETQPPEPKAEPKEKQVVGDLAIAKPQDQVKKATGKSEDEEKKEEKPRARPRTVAEAKAGMLGEKIKQQGGARRLALDPSFDVKATSFGNYDREFIEAVQQRWYQLLEGRNTVPGRIVVEFRLNYSGRVTDLEVVENSTKNALLEIICSGAIADPSPYRPWPADMRREMRSDSRDVRFTFYYD